jgi:ParB family transcriptional regulator, chromosome partitioning protein
MHLKKLALIDIIEPTNAVRSNISQQKINELADSIMQIGLLNPLTVTKKNLKYEIIAGHCRYLALRQLQEKTVECNIVEASGEKLDQMKLDENYIRTEIEEFDEAVYLEAIMKQHELTQNELANRIGKSTSYVNERLAIMSYDPVLLQALQKHKITFSVAREFNRVKDPKQLRQFVHYAVVGGCTPKLAREWVQDLQRINDEGTASEGESASDEQSERAVERAIMNECQVCHDIVDTRHLKSVWACPKCRESINLP